MDERRQGVGIDGREATLQWFRGGYRHRGLDWAGVQDPQVRQQLNEELEAWRERPWFERWRQASLDGFAKVRHGPHCWFSLPSLVPDRYWAALLTQGPARRTPGP